MFGLESKNECGPREPNGTGPIRLSAADVHIPPSSRETFARLLASSGEQAVTGKVCLVERHGRAFMTIGFSYEPHVRSIDRALADPGFAEALGIPKELYKVTGSTDVSIDPETFITGGSFMYLRSCGLAVAGEASTMFGALNRRADLFDTNRPPSDVVGEMIAALGASMTRGAPSELDTLQLPARPRVVGGEMPDGAVA